MADGKGIISNTIVVNTGDAEKKIKSLAGQLGALKKAYERAFVSDTGSTIFKKESVSAEELQKRIVNITREISKMNTAMNQGTMKDSSINGAVKILEGSEQAAKKAQEAVKKWSQEIQAAKAAEKAKFDAEWATMKANRKPDMSVANPENIAQLREQFMLRQRISEATERTNVKAIADAEKLAVAQSKANSAALKDQMKPENYVNLQTQIRNAANEAERLYLIQRKSGAPTDIKAYNDAHAALKGLVTTQEQFNATIGKSSGLLDGFGRRIKSHLEWITSGALLAAFAVIPNAIENIARETEVLGQKLKQNLELADRYHGDMNGLESDIKHLGEVAGVFAVGYGANVKDVMEMMQILSRRFKSPEELTYYTNLAMTMHKLDFVTPKKAAEDLEAVILSMGLDFKGAKDFVDQFSVAVHTARITGTDLLSGLQRSGAGFKNMNMGTAEAIALISTLSTVTAKAGANVGTSLSSLITNVDFKKGAEALKAYNIEVYDNNGKMRQGVEVWREMAAVFNGLKVGDDDQAANKLATALSGGKFRINDLKAILDNWQEFEKILTNIKTKASPELTTELLRTGMQTYDTNVKQMTASLQVLGITIGNELLPMLKSMTIGLTEGVEWLNKHREETAKVIKYIGLFAEALVLYRIQQTLATTSLFNFLGTSKMMAANAPTFVGAIASMGRSIAGLGITIGSTLVKMAGFMAMAELISRVGAGWSQESAEKDFNQSIAGAGSMDGGAGHRLSSEEQAIVAAQQAIKDFRDNNAIVTAFGGVMYKNGDDKFKADTLDQNLRDLLQQRQAKKGLDKVNAMVDLATNGMPGKAEKDVYAPVEGIDLGGGGGGGTGSNIDPSVSTLSKLEVDASLRKKNELFLASKIATDSYAMSIDNLKTKEEIQGKSAALTVDVLGTKIARVAQLTAEQSAYQAEMDKLQDTIDAEIEQNEVLRGQMDDGEKRYANMSKAEKANRREVNSYLLTTESALNKNIKLWQDYAAKRSEAEKGANALSNDIAKENSPLKPEEAYKQSMDRNNVAQDILLARATNKFDPNNEVTLNAIKLHKLNEDKKLANDELLRLNKVLEGEEEVLRTKATDDNRQALQEIVNAARDAAQKQLLIVEQNANAIKDAEYAKNSKIRDGLYGVTQEVLIQGNSLKSVWKTLWNQLANDALKALLKIQNNTPGILSSILGLFGAGDVNLSGTRPNGVSGPTGSNGGFYSHNAAGSIGNKEQLSWIREGNKEEAIIPLEDHRERGKSLWLQAGAKLGMLNNGTNVTANVSQKTMDTARATQQLASINAEHLGKLDTQIGLMTQQNSMILTMLQSGGGQGSVMLQPIIAQQSMSVEEFAAIAGKAKSLGYNIG